MCVPNCHVRTEHKGSTVEALDTSKTTVEIELFIHEAWLVYIHTATGGGTVRLAGRSTGWRRGTRLANTDFLDTRHKMTLKNDLSFLYTHLIL